MPPITFKGKTYNSEFEMPQELPTTEDLYPQSAPADMRHLPSDESVYRPSAPVIDPEYSTIEPESSLVLRGLVFGILWSLVIVGIVFVVIQFYW